MNHKRQSNNKRLPPHFYLLPFTLYLLSFLHCANPISPTGGPKDELPPVVAPDKSTPDKQTNFNKQTIELTFNEWVVLEDVFNQVVVSPPLEFKPELRLKGKTLLFEFDEREELRPEATYTINFGEAIKDLTEKNPADNLRFVFSTGDYIDSLQISGTVVDAKTGEAIEGVLFMLYENLADSVVRTQRPFYFAKTGKQGRFQIDNVKAGAFKGFALKDVDFNYLYNLPNEQIGFPDSIILIADSLQPNLRIRFFQEAPPLLVSDIESRNYGLIRLAFNQRPLRLGLEYQDVGQTVVYEYDKDSVRVWYQQSDEQSWNLYVQKDTVLNDTIQVRPEKRLAFFDQNKRLRLTGPAGRGAIKLNPAKPAVLGFRHPLVRFDTAHIRLYQDTLRKLVLPDLEIDSSNRRNLSLRYPWKEGLPYQLELMPGALRDIYGLENDTLILSYQINLRKSYGNLFLTVSGLDSSLNYVVRVMGKGEEPIESFEIRGSTSQQQKFLAMDPGQYTVHIITDRNGNGHWDTGNYDLQQQPEAYFIKELEQLRANWDLEAEVSLE